jgi:hypothetical protein
MHGKIVATLLFAAGVWLQGCCADRSKDRLRERSADALQQPVVRKLGSMTLTESDTAYLGRPAALSVDPVDGSLYVSDAFWGRVLRFSAAGELSGATAGGARGPES